MVLEQQYEQVGTGRLLHPFRLQLLRIIMRYLVRGRVKPGRETDLLKAIEEESLGQGSVAEGEYLRNMHDARLCPDQTARWVEVCYCPTPLQEERPYWEEYFDLVRVQDAHDRRKCSDENGSEPWACNACHCTERLEEKLKATGTPFLKSLRFDQTARKHSSEGNPIADHSEGDGPSVTDGRKSA